MDVSNKQFLEAIFGEGYIYAHVTSFIHDPGNIPLGENGKAWAGGYYKDTVLTPGVNQFYTVSLFGPDGKGRSRRRKKHFSACCVVGLDDVREKLPIEQVEKLPPPSIVLKSSLHSEQWLYILDTPETNIDRIDNLHDGLIASDLAPDSQDPGQRGVTRYLRLPEGCNTKVKRIQENGGTPPRCEVVQWHPERRYTLEELAVPFAVDLGVPRKGSRVDSASDISDHPLLNSSSLHIKSRLSPGRYDITCPWVDEHSEAADDGAAIFTNTNGSLGFKCHHGVCESRTGVHLLQIIEEREPGFSDRLNQWQVVRKFAGVEKEPTGSPLTRLLSMVADGEVMMKQMSEDKFVLKDLAILGQWTVFYAGPNIGKTLLTQWLLYEAITTAEINGDDIFYLNVDDTARSGAEKAVMAKEFGYHMLLSSVKGFKAGVVLGLLNDLIVSGEAKGKVFVLDTLKKFTDLMDKKLSSGFGNIAREFVAAGGTLICLAHVNKHKGGDGKSIYAGTSDIRDDADNTFTIEHLGSDERFLKTTHTVEFHCSKSRGDVAQSVTFQYTKEKGAGYRAMFDSVIRLNCNDAEAARSAAEDTEEQKGDAEVIEQIKVALTNGQSVKSDIEKFMQSTSHVSRNKVRAILDKYESRLWLMEKGVHNASVYSLKKVPVPPVSFL